MQTRCIFVVSPLLSTWYSAFRLFFWHLLHQDVLWCWYCRDIVLPFCCLWYAFSVMFQKFSEWFRSVTICWISCKLYAIFRTFLAISSICSHFLWCTARHTKTANSILFVSFLRPVSDVLSSQIVSLSISYLYFILFFLTCQELCERSSILFLLDWFFA